ncbi:MAG TPA: glycosyltransferase [Acidimicrobiia bacterium]|nr:glycosyltransferase [Acidimicrobiia bacterium]
MSKLATVLVPTHNHGPLLAHAVDSALAQSVTDIEVFIVGDGVDQLTRDVALELRTKDQRVTFFDNEKGPRHGELLRHEALQQASGQVVCYLSDDDLWLPDHVASMFGLLDGADFAHAMPIGIGVDGTVSPWAGHLEVESSRDQVIRYVNFIPLSCGAHTLDRYRSLPFGWRTTPEGISTDVYMWSQILEQPGCVGRSGSRPTVVHFPSPWREEMSPEQRLEELAAWHQRIRTPGFEAELLSDVVDFLSRDRANRERVVADLRERVTRLESSLGPTRDQLQEEKARLAETTERLARIELQLAIASSQLDEQRSQMTQARSRIKDQQDRLETAKRRMETYQAGLQRKQRQLDRISTSLTWRTRAWLLRLPGLTRLTQWAGKARARRAAE